MNSRQMCHLVMDPSIEVQRLSYAMLKKAAEKRTEWVVIEVGVGNLGAEDNGEAAERVNAMGTGEAGPAAPTFDIPADVEAVAIQAIEEEKPKEKVARRKDGRRRKKRIEVAAKDEGPSLLPRELLAIIQKDEEADVFGWMLGWMLVFDLFQDAVSGTRRQCVYGD